MERYLDPKADLTFKKIFGTHPDLLMSLLNALLPLKDGQLIESVEYLPGELYPVSPLLKNTIVDVRCKDNRGRQFVVEMQMEWTTAFKQRVLFNASKAYVAQIGNGQNYKLLQPVYSLNFVNAVFEPDVPDFRHDYGIVHDKYSDKTIEGLHLTFLELPKFRPDTMTEKRMAVLWLRFLTEIDNKTQKVPRELEDNPEIHKALTQVRESAFTASELYSYDKFWDAVSSQKTLQDGRYEEGLSEGLEKGRAEERLSNARALLAAGMDRTMVCKALALSETEIRLLD